MVMHSTLPSGTRLIRGLAWIVPLLAVPGRSPADGPQWPWSQQSRVEAADSGSPDYFGRRVALQADTAAIGAEYDDAPGSNSGSAYVFLRRNGLTWSQQARLVAADGAANDLFGCAVGLDADTLVVGALSDDLPSSKTDAGSAYVFVRSGTAWSQQAKLTASDREVGDNFGSSVAVDGDTAIAGAPNNDDPVAGTDAGAAYIFVRSGTVWSQQAVLLASDRSADDRFGGSVAIRGDTAVVGAWQADNVGAVFSGAVYVFTRSGTAWTQQARLAPGDIVAGDAFGRSVSLGQDNLAVGADGCDASPLSNVGAVYLFSRTGTTWFADGKLMLADRLDNDQTGAWVSLSGARVLCAPRTRSPTNAYAYVFARTGVWIEEARLAPAGPTNFASFGYGVALDGDTAVCTAPNETASGGANSGAAYLFVMDNDRDGLGNALEASLGSNPDLPDSDGDGIPDYEELVTGTSLTNATPVSERFAAQVLPAASPVDGIVLTWPSLADRLYSVEETVSPMLAWQSTTMTDAPGTGDAMSYTGAMPSASGFLRIGVRMAP